MKPYECNTSERFYEAVEMSSMSTISLMLVSRLMEQVERNDLTRLGKRIAQQCKLLRRGRHVQQKVTLLSVGTGPCTCMDGSRVIFARDCVLLSEFKPGYFFYPARGLVLGGKQARFAH